MKRDFIFERSRLLFVIVLIFALMLLSGSAQARAYGPALDSAVAGRISLPVQPGISASAGEAEWHSVIVTLKAQANLLNILDRNRNSRISKVEQALQTIADATQTRIRALIATRQSEGKVTEVEYFWVFNGLAITATADVIQELSALPEVRTVTPDDIIHAAAETEASGLPEANLNLINAPELWQLGYHGQGIVVANMDTGVYLNHPDLVNKWRGGANSWYDPNGEHPSIPTDYSGHGTWTMGVMVGGDAGGTFVGVAPSAQWIAVKIFNDAGSASVSGIHSGFQWLIDPDGDPATPDAPHVVNSSWTYPGPGCNLEFELDLQALRATGILPVFAAGNFGPGGGTSASPSNNPSAFAVGSIDNNSVIYTNSSRGPSSCGEAPTIFPEVVAPGVNIHTTDLYGYYINSTGTSLSAPHVSGGLALLLNAFPDLLTYEQEAALLNSTADLGVSSADDTFGFGRIDLLAAYQLIQTGDFTPTPPPAPDNLALSRPATVSSSQDNGHTGAKAVDGDTTTFWQSKQIKGNKGPSSEWITVDLGSSASLHQVVLRWDANYATGYQIRVSEENSTWTTVFSTSTGNGGNDAIALDSIPARYVKMESTAWSNASLRTWLRELEVYGTSSAATPTPDPTSTPSPAGTVHVGDLDGSSGLRRTNRWDAVVTVTVHDGTENVVDGATITGYWSTGGSSSCVTNSLGQCTVSKNNLQGGQASIAFTVDSISYSAHNYQPAGNHDPDGDSDGSEVIITKP